MLIADDERPPVALGLSGPVPMSDKSPIFPVYITKGSGKIVIYDLVRFAKLRTYNLAS